MKKIIASIVVISTALTLFGCGEKETVSEIKTETAVNVTVKSPKRMTVENTVTYTGEIKASQSTSVSSKASGVARAVYKEIGDYVEEGETLLVIDDTDYRTQYNQAQAAYSGALAQYNSIKNGSTQQTKLQLESALSAAKIEYNNAKTNYDNQKVLYENGAVSKASYDAAVTRFDNAKLNLDTAQNNYDLTINVVLEESKANAQAAVNTAKVSVQAAQNALNNTVVKAPISGYIASRNANKGQMVPAGVEIFSIKATQSVEAQINVTEAVISEVALGAKAVVNVKAANTENIEGTVTNVSPVKNPQTGMYLVCVAVENADGKIKDGMFADIKLTLNDSVDALAIPSEAVLEDKDGTKYVYIASENEAKRKNIKIGIINDKYTEVVSGISEKDRVIVSGKDYLSEINNKIRIVK